MPSKATKRLNKKEINNIIKEAEKKVEENIDTIERISPFYDFIQEREQKLAAFSRFSNDYQVKQILPSDPNKCNFKDFILLYLMNSRNYANKIYKFNLELMSA